MMSLKVSPNTAFYGTETWAMKAENQNIIIIILGTSLP